MKQKTTYLHIYFSLCSLKDQMPVLFCRSSQNREVNAVGFMIEQQQQIICDTKEGISM